MNMEELIRHIDIPDNIAEYIEFRNGVNLSFNINVVDGVNGYGRINLYTVKLSKLTRTCNRCGYDPLWNPKGDECGCHYRHTYNGWRYDDVFIWSPIENEFSLEDAFNHWLNMQPDSIDEPTLKMTFGRIGR